MRFGNIELTIFQPIMGFKFNGLWIVLLILLNGLWSPRIMAAGIVYKDYAFAQLRDGDTMWLGSSPEFCPAGQYLGRTELVDRQIKNRFCWRLNKHSGLVEIADGRWTLGVEQFNWTIEGARWLKGL